MIDGSHDTTLSMDLRIEVKNKHYNLILKVSQEYH